MKFGLAVGALAILLTSCGEKREADVCTSINKVIDQQIVEIALSEHDAHSDRSAIQQGARAAGSQQMMGVIIANLELARQHECRPRRLPIDPSRYSEQASACYSAKLETQLASYRSDKLRIAAAADMERKTCDLRAWEASADAK